MSNDNDKYALNADSFETIDALSIAFACVERDNVITPDMKRNALSTLRAIMLQRDCEQFDPAVRNDMLHTLIDVIVFG
jgi:hypothetical protein